MLISRNPEQPKMMPELNWDVSFLNIDTVLLNWHFNRKNVRWTAAVKHFDDKLCWRNSCYPEEAVGGLLWPQAALHPWRELILQANSEVIIVVTGLLSENENEKQRIQFRQNTAHIL